MPHAPQPPSDPEWKGTLIETDEDVHQGRQVHPPVQPAPKAAAPVTPAPKPSPPPAPAASLYRPTLRPPVAFLTVFDDGKSDGEALRLRGDRFVIGRSEGDFLLPHDALISARHLEIVRQRVGEQYRWVISDLQTTNGLFVRASRIALGDKAEFLAGKGRYRLEAPRGEQPNTVDYFQTAPPIESTRRPGDDAAALSGPALIELVGEKVVFRLPLVKSEYWIGSDPACPICRVGDPFIDPWHVRLHRAADGAWTAYNNKSPNGLWYRVPQITVTDSCLFQIGEQRFRLKGGG